MCLGTLQVVQICLTKHYSGCNMTFSPQPYFQTGGRWIRPSPVSVDRTHKSILAGEHSDLLKIYEVKLLTYVYNPITQKEAGALP